MNCLTHLPSVCAPLLSPARHACITFVLVVAYLPEGRQGNRRGFPWSGVRGRRAPQSCAGTLTFIQVRGAAPGDPGRRHTY